MAMKVQPPGNNALPDTIKERMELALRVISAPSKIRLLKYIYTYPDRFTHQIAADCAVGFPPNRLGELNREVLPQYGLHLLCHQPDKWLTNRWGDVSRVHQWRLVLVPQKQEVA